MKNFSFSIIAASFFLLLSCSTDDGDLNVDPANLTGTWNLVNMTTQNGQAIVTEDGVTISVDFSLETSNENLRIMISENPNVISSEGSFTQRTTITAIGQTETEESVIEGVFLDGAWELNGDNLIITSGDDMLEEFSPSFEITRLTDTELEIRQNLNQNITLEGTNVQASGILIINFNR
ncbi:hypothetical protein GTQ40_02200 [Flavobacteriaceae bacterium R38]|nr:hypothetical protein [Flavobacteriaceae bacterium R38]